METPEARRAPSLPAGAGVARSPTGSSADTSAAPQALGAPPPLDLRLRLCGAYGGEPHDLPDARRRVRGAAGAVRFPTPFDTARIGDWHTWGKGLAPARAAFRQITRTAFFAGLLSFLLASATAALLTRALTRPLSALTDGARRLGAGERGLQLRVPRSRDELRTLTEAFNSLVTGLEQQEAWRRNLVADIAHDLRTPLSVMRGELEALQDGIVTLDEATLSRLHAEVLTLSKLVSSLRELSLAEAGALPLRLQTLPLGSFLERLCESFQARAAEAGVTLTLAAVPPGMSATFDPDQLARVLGNLLDNALRYAAPGAAELGAERLSSGVRLWLRGHGPGVTNDAERLFERFFQGTARGPVTLGVKKVRDSACPSPAPSSRRTAAR